MFPRFKNQQKINFKTRAGELEGLHQWQAHNNDWHNQIVKFLFYLPGSAVTMNTPLPKLFILTFSSLRLPLSAHDVQTVLASFVI